MGLLDSVLGTHPRSASGGMSPITMALLGLLAYRTLHGKGRLAQMLGGASPSSGAQPGTGGDVASPSIAPRQQGSSGGIGDLLGGLLGAGGSASLGSTISGGLKDLLRQFQSNGQGDKAESWVAKGPNKPVSPSELEQALGEDKIRWLMEQTGLSRGQLLAGLSRELPNAVDRLTPNGRVPDSHEAARMM
jgi:uncharacterized protein YidB (DUF937 family)